MALSFENNSVSRKRAIADDGAADEATRSRRRRMLATPDQKTADRKRRQRSAETYRNKSVAFEAAVMDIDDLLNASVEEYNCGTIYTSATAGVALQTGPIAYSQQAEGGWNSCSSIAEVCRIRAGLH